MNKKYAKIYISFSKFATKLFKMKKYNFCDRHIGPREADINSILDAIGASSIQELIDQTIPAHIQLQSEMDLPKEMKEVIMLKKDIQGSL